MLTSFVKKYWLEIWFAIIVLGVIFTPDLIPQGGATPHYLP
jgi:Sec-independent protein secretion pathway component TatC